MERNNDQQARNKEAEKGFGNVSIYDVKHSKFLSLSATLQKLS